LASIPGLHKGLKIPALKTGTWEQKRGDRGLVNRTGDGRRDIKIGLGIEKLD
jgi:hypothetical protein